MDMPWRSSASAMYANFGIQNFEADLLLWLWKVHGL